MSTTRNTVTDQLAAAIWNEGEGHWREDRYRADDNCVFCDGSASAEIEHEEDCAFLVAAAHMESMAATS